MNRSCRWRQGRPIRRRATKRVVTSACPSPARSANENAVIIDGLNTTDLNTGVVATQLHQYFIKDIQVITGGYQGGIRPCDRRCDPIATKTGSNEFHGGVFGRGRRTKPRRTPSRAWAKHWARTKQPNQYDFGFELGAVSRTASGFTWALRRRFRDGHRPGCVRAYAVRCVQTGRTRPATPIQKSTIWRTALE